MSQMQSNVRRTRPWARLGALGCAAVVAITLGGCASLSLGSRFPINPRQQIKVGHDSEKDVIAKMGQPFRRATDAQGRAVLTYVWADGNGYGEKCVVAFNKNGLVYVVEVVQ